MSARGTSTLDQLGLSPLGHGPHGRAGALPGAASGGWLAAGGDATLVSTDPTTGEALATVQVADDAAYAQVIGRAQARFAEWRLRPGPRRGELVRKLGERLRAHKDALGELISLEVGKIRSEGLGEVQEMIDICDFAVGLSRQLHGLTIASERPGHRMSEQWHPLGPVGVITAFNFPMAVWAWNAALAAVCGDVTIWKPSPRASLCGLAVQRLCMEVEAEEDAAGVFGLLIDGTPTSRRLAADPRIPLVSFTGSVAAGRAVATEVAGRLGRSLLELGGNNAAIVLDDADLDLAVRAIVFGAAGTAGQRCTTTRRVFAQRGVIDRLTDRVVAAYRTVRIGDPLERGTLMGPLIGADAVEAYRRAIAAAIAQGGEVRCGGKVVDGPGWFVEPTVIRAPAQADFPIAHDETFAPILYVFEVADLDEAIAANNAVPQGLSSAIFTEGLRSAERFLSPAGSDCGIANVNTGTSGAEIGGAFGGEKDTGGGRESGSDAWKAYMRRQTSTVNYGGALPLAQGVEFPAG
ncbi:MAG: aldehyde dehydrogenase family protein [Kofleriaceae bacterium]|nr:aldehyde dehydrogenase family protein [Myxococcales bacterium]MCB9562952.1 aldehyde dehydrogenase family protein [Kofleriaceae bacterium]MCB9572672.1 aldehyde dehydrogenase family protein [Kofleriaceae bacterium]